MRTASATRNIVPKSSPTEAPWHFGDRRRGAALDGLADAERKDRRKVTRPVITSFLYGISHTPPTKPRKTRS